MITFTESTGKVHSFSDNTLLIFLDETGHEELADKNFPIFGFGGCLVRAMDYEREVVISWKRVIDTFPSEMIPLHASELDPKKLTSQQLNELSTFFSKNQFGRFSAVVTNKTVMQSKYKLMDIVAALIHKRIIEIAKWLPFDQIVMIFEESDRTKMKISASFSGYDFTVDNQKVPTERFFMPKKANDAGLQVADFIVHTSGSTVMSKLKGKISKNLQRKDFKLIFDSIDPKYASFMEVNEIHDN